MSQIISAPLAGLIIDKISITRSETRPSRVQAAQTAIETIARTGRYRTSYRATDRYAIDAKLQIPTSQGNETLHLQAGPRDPTISAYRAEFNPAKLGPQGLTVVDTLLLRVTGLSLHEFVAEGTVTRLDIAIDSPGITVNDIIARQRSARKFGLYTDQFGVPETLYLGGAQPATIYNKKANRRSATIPSLRVERRLQPRCPGTDLLQIKNPFAGLSVIPTKILIPALTDVPPDMFCDCARTRGLQRAAAMMPRPVHQRIKALVDDPANSIVRDDVWGAWPTTLNASGLLPTTIEGSAPAPAMQEHPVAVDDDRCEVNSL